MNFSFLQNCSPLKIITCVALSERVWVLTAFNQRKEINQIGLDSNLHLILKVIGLYISQKRDVGFARKHLDLSYYTSGKVSRTASIKCGTDCAALCVILTDITKKYYNTVRHVNNLSTLCLSLFLLHLFPVWNENLLLTMSSFYGRCASKHKCWSLWN
jgi:hypothetical protein